MVKVIKFFLFDDLNYRINYTSEGVDKKITSAILSLFLSYFIKGINTGILYKKIDNKYLILKVENENDDNEYVIKFVYLDNLSDYPVKLMYEKGFIDSDFKHEEYDNLEFETLSKYMKSIDAFNFKEIVSALFKAKYYNSAIRIRGNIKELLLWIAAIQTIFPQHFAEGISFKIEQYKNDIGMASISISDNLIDLRYRLNLDSETENIERYSFTSILEMHYLVPSNNLEAFFLFATHFDYKELDERLEDIYNIYMISRVGIGDRDYSIVKLAIDNLEEIGTKEAKRIVILNMLKVIDKLTTEMDVKFFKLTMGFAFRACNEMESLFINEMCKELYIRSLVSTLFGGRYKSIEQFEQAVSEIESLTDKRELYKYILDDKRLDNLELYLTIDLTPERVLCMLKHLLLYNIELGYKWNKFTEKLQEIITRAINVISKSNLSILNMLEEILGDDEYVSSILIRVFDAIENEQLQKNLIKDAVKFFMGIEDEKAVEIRKRLSYDETGLLLLYEEFKLTMETENYTTEGFKAYLEVFYSCREYFNKSFNRAVAYMIANIEEDEAYKFSMFIVNEIKDRSFKENILPNKTISNIILGIEQNVDFEKCDDVYEVLDELNSIKEYRNIKTSINITKLLNVQKLLSEDERINPLDFEALDMQPYKLKEASYEKYKEINLNKIIAMCSDKEEHKVVADAFMTKDNFIFDYMKIALSDENIDKDSAISFLIYYLYYVHPVYKVNEKEEILVKLRIMMIERISELSFNTVCAIDDKVKGEFQKENLSMPVEWEEIFSSIKKIKSDGNFVNKLKFMMKK